jgi:hypothetical protein
LLRVLFIIGSSSLAPFSSLEFREPDSNIYCRIFETALSSTFQLKL